MKAVIALLACSTVAAAEPSEITVDQAVALYRRHSPRLAVARATLDVAGADLIEARIYPNPDLGLSTTRNAIGDTAGPSGQFTLDLGIPILLGNKRSHRTDAARAKVIAARAELAGTQGEAELEIRLKFTALLEARDKVAALTTALGDARALREIVVGRTTAGAGSNYAVERMDLAIASLASRLADAVADETAAAGELAIVVGMPGWRPRALGDLATVAGSAPPAEHPAVVRARADRDAARAEILRARADGVPTPSLGLQAFTTVGPNGLALVAGFSVPLPLFDRNQGAIARARATARRAELEMIAATTELATDLERANRVLGVRRDALARFEADALQRLARLRAMAEASYRNGQSGIVELLDALEAINEAQVRAVELRAAVARGEIGVRRATQGR